MDVRDLGGQLDFPRLGRAGALSRSVWEASHGVAAVGALRLGFRPSWVLLGGSICRLVCMPLTHRMSLLPPLEHFVLLSLGLSGPEKSLKLAPPVIFKFARWSGWCGPGFSHRLDQVSLDATVFGFLAA